MTYTKDPWDPGRQNSSAVAQRKFHWIRDISILESCTIMVGFTLAILLAVFCQGVNGVINLVAVYPDAGHTFLPPAQRSTNVKRQDIVILPKELPKATVGEEIVFGLFEDINHLKGSINSVKIRQAGRFVWSGVVQDEGILLCTPA